jgi:hypothetical protein
LASKRPILEEYLDHLRVERALAENSLLAYGRDLRALLEWSSRRGREGLLTLEPSDITEYMGALRAKGLSPRSVARACTLTWVFRFAVREGRLPGPLQNLRPRAFWSPLLSPPSRGAPAAPTSPLRLRDRAISRPTRRPPGAELRAPSGDLDLTSAPVAWAGEARLVLARAASRGGTWTKRGPPPGAVARRTPLNNRGRAVADGSCRPGGR